MNWSEINLSKLLVVNWQRRARDRPPWILMTPVTKRQHKSHKYSQLWSYQHSTHRTQTHPQQAFLCLVQFVASNSIQGSLAAVTEQLTFHLETALRSSIDGFKVYEMVVDEFVSLLFSVSQHLLLAFCELVSVVVDYLDWALQLQLLLSTLAVLFQWSFGLKFLCIMNCTLSIHEFGR